MSNEHILGVFEDQLTQHVHQLDGKVYLGMRLASTRNVQLWIFASMNEKRCRILYQSLAPRRFMTRLLIDRSASRTIRAYFELANGAIDNDTLYSTVNYDVTLQTVLYFLRTERYSPQHELPPRVEWASRASIKKFYI